MPYNYPNSSSSDDEDTPDKRRNNLRAGKRLRRRGRNTHYSSDDDDDEDRDCDDGAVDSNQFSRERRPRLSEDSLTTTAKTSVDTTTSTATTTPTSSSVQPPCPRQGERASGDGGLILEDPDADTLRILVSTDNHLGFAETDNVRGNDSFAALEEVLYLAKEYKCDMVMLAGDLFHENRPSRRTLFKTMDIFRRYCMGPGAIQVQIVNGSTTSQDSNNNNSKNRSPLVRGYVNYEDPNYSVDLPVFSIHGNHDDPSRDGGNSDLYAALDLLDVVNLVNYFGKQEDTQNIRVDPILLKKGNTRVALYGLGSMRDERLNRMWKGGHLTFSRPSERSATTAEENHPWFNIFALHQNRDRGRGAKNCVKEDMIPEWIDFVCWGHEHECDIELTESVVGTFRISQPGSSVATSLVEGESRRKKVGVLDVRHGQFRMTSIPLTQVRSFVVSSVKLAEEPRLDPDDPKVDTRVSKVLEERVRVLVHDAREKRRELLQDAESGGNLLARFCQENNNNNNDNMPLKHTLQKEDEVLVRLKVDHTGFAAVNNQRFGAKFVGEVANPTDILLFHRKKTESSGTRSKSIKDIAPIEPSEIEEMNIEELIVEQFESETTKLQLFDDKKISMALDNYVGKQEARAINEALDKLLGKQQDRLIKNEGTNFEEDEEEEEEAEKARKKTKKSSRRKRSQETDDYSDEDEEETEESPPPKSRKVSQQRTSRKATSSRKTSYKEPDSDDYIEEDSPPSKRAPQSRGGSSRARGRRSASASYEDSEGEDTRAVDPPPRSRKRTTKKAIDYSIDNSDHSLEVVEESKPKRGRDTKTSRAGSSSSSKISSSANKRGRKSNESSSSGALSQSQLSFQPIKRKASREPPKSRGNSRTSRYKQDDSDSGDSFTLPGHRRSYEDDGDDWGTAKSGTAL